MKTAVITGGSGAIGSGLVAEFARDYRVVFTYCSDADNARTLAAKCGAEAVRCNLTDGGDIKKLLGTAGGCDLLINNAGIGSVGLFTDISDEELDEVIDVDLIGAMKLTKAFLPHMVGRKKGCIINISSIWGVYGGSCEVAYSAAKAGLIGFTKALSKEAGFSGIRVNCIAPGFIESKINSHLSDSEIRKFAEDTSLGRIGNSYDVALAARYLSEADFVTGQVLGVDGGF